MHPFEVVQEQKLLLWLLHTFCLFPDTHKDVFEALSQHLRKSLSRKQLTADYFRKKLHFRYLTGFLIHLWFILHSHNTFCAIYATLSHISIFCWISNNSDVWSYRNLKAKLYQIFWQKKSWPNQRATWTGEEVFASFVKFLT